jgi:hypothetical protein
VIVCSRNVRRFSCGCYSSVYVCFCWLCTADCLPFLFLDHDAFDSHRRSSCIGCFQSSPAAKQSSSGSKGTPISGVFAFSKQPIVIPRRAATAAASIDSGAPSASADPAGSPTDAVDPSSPTPSTTTSHTLTPPSARNHHMYIAVDLSLDDDEEGDDEAGDDTQDDESQLSDAAVPRPTTTLTASMFPADDESSSPLAAPRGGRPMSAPVVTAGQGHATVPALPVRPAVVPPLALGKLGGGAASSTTGASAIAVGTPSLQQQQQLLLQLQRQQEAQAAALAAQQEQERLELQRQLAWGHLPGGDRASTSSSFYSTGSGTSSLSSSVVTSTNVSARGGGATPVLLGGGGGKKVTDRSEADSAHDGAGVRYGSVDCSLFDVCVVVWTSDSVWRHDVVMTESFLTHLLRVVDGGLEF